jgi:hypothetical protein
MTTKSHNVAGLLAIACALALTPDSAKAAIVYTDGDLILGFRATGGLGASTDYLIDLGSAASFLALAANSQVNLSLGPIGTDLVALYGANWSSRVDLFWSLSGVQKIAGNGFANNTMFATRSDSVDALPGPLTNTTVPWTRPSSFGAGAPAGKMLSLGQKYGNGTTGTVVGTDQIESTNVPGALIQPISQVNSYNSFQSTLAFGLFSDANGIEGNFGSSSSAVLDLYRLDAGSGPSTFIGSLAISNAGQVTATGAGFVPTPEPSVALSVAFGGAVLGAMRRRRSFTRAN